MTKGISLKLDLEIYEETERLVKSAGTSRNKYINMALKEYNKRIRREELKKAIKEASLKCRAESMNVLNEFEQLPDEIDPV